jgi:hypothetical protein
MVGNGISRLESTPIYEECEIGSAAFIREVQAVACGCQRASPGMEGRPLRVKRNERASTIFYDGLG